MTTARLKTMAFVAIPVLAAGEFVVDSMTPLGMADWIWYVIPLLFSLYVGGRSLPYVLATILSVLLLVGIFLSPPGVDPQWSLISRATGALMLWVMALTISHHKKTVAQLHQLSRAVEHSPVSIVITNLAGNIEYVNPKFTEITGYSLQEVVGKNPHILKSGEMPAENYKRLWDTIIAGGEWRGEFHNRKKNGELYWASASISPIVDANGRTTHFLAVEENIDKRKHSEEALARERNLLRQMFDVLPDYLYLKDTQSRFLVCNNRRSDKDALQNTEELIGKTDADFFPPELAAQFRADELAVLAGTPLIDKEETLTRPDGRQQFILTTKLPFRDSSGKIIGLLGYGRDVTEYKRTEAALVAEQKLLSNLLTGSPDIIYFKDRQSRFIRINETFSRKMGMSGPQVAIGKNDFDLFGEHARQAYEDEQRIMTTGEPMIDKEEQEDWKDGRVTWVSSTKMPLRDSSGQIIGIMGISRDITGRKHAEQELAEALDFNQKIISDASAGIVVFKAAGECVLANQFAARTLNGTAPQLREQNFRQLDSWRDSGMLKVAEETLATGKPQHCEAHFVSTFGREIWLVCHFTPFTRGDEAHLLLLFTDITGRKQAEEHVQAQAALLDKAQDAIFVLDADERITYWNKSAERIYGWTAAEAVGKSSVELLFKGVVTPQLANTLKIVNLRGEWVGELQEYTKTGKVVIVQGRCNLIRDEKGRHKSKLIINTDITEKKNLEAQFLRSQRMEGIGALAGGIAHDLNNVLTPLLVAVQVLKDKVKDEDGQKLLLSLETNVKRGAGLVKQVLAFGRGIAGEQITVNPKHITREIKQIIHETFPKSLEFELHTAPDLWTITGDPTQLHQVLLNLCVNARDAMPQGGKLSLHMENVMFDETYAAMNPEAKAGPYLLIKVTDTGTGIPKEIQDKIFDPFFTTKELGKGTGLGLSTTLTIVKGHAGFIHLHSSPGRGSTFEIYLPANAVPAEAEHESTGHSRLPRGHNELVLVVDDEEPIRRIAQKTLERFGYRVMLAADGSEAVSQYAAQQQDIAVVVTDMVMPVMDGPSTITALKAINADVKIITSTGMASEGGLAKAKDAGVRHFMPKPYTAETMLQTLDEILHEHHGN